MNSLAQFEANVRSGCNDKNIENADTPLVMSKDRLCQGERIMHDGSLDLPDVLIGNPPVQDHIAGPCVDGLVETELPVQAPIEVQRCQRIEQTDQQLLPRSKRNEAWACDHSDGPLPSVVEVGAETPVES